jgi:hypothetical protein
VPSFLAKLDDIQERHDSQFGLVLEGRKPKAPQRLGYAEGVPTGGATATQPGDSWGGGDYSNRAARMDQLLGLYINCYPLSVGIDVIAKTATAGGLTPRPIRDINSPVNIKQTPPPGVVAVTKLLRYVNPSMDCRQLMRGVITDMYIYGDSFTEVVYLKGAPLALYPLDPSTITVLTDDHGDPTGYHQETKRNKTAEFALSQVIHVRFDAPGNTIYGLSPIEKLILPVTTWIFGASLLRMTFMKGDPLRAHVDWPIALPDVERQRFQDQYRTRNLGLSNIGTLLETKGGATVQELGTNNISVWRGNQADVRDEILSGLGVPGSKAGVSQAGGLGGGLGTSEDRNFRINTIGPAQELVLEKFSFKLLYQAYGVEDWALYFGTVDWRDDYVLEQIRDMRIRNGSWSVNRARADIGEPPVPGGDVAVLVDRQNMVVIRDLDALSKANLAVVQLAAAGADATQQGVGVQSNTTTSKTKNAPTNPPTNPGKPDRMNPAQKLKQATAKKAKQSPSGSASPKAPGGTESDDYGFEVEESDYDFAEEYINLTILGPVPNA